MLLFEWTKKTPISQHRTEEREGHFQPYYFLSTIIYQLILMLVTIDHKR